jgi:hypothetical protein
MIETLQQYEKAQEELRALEDWLERLQQEFPFPAKGLTKAGVRKAIARLQEVLAIYEGGHEADRPAPMGPAEEDPGV